MLATYKLVVILILESLWLQNLLQKVEKHMCNAVMECTAEQQSPRLQQVRMCSNKAIINTKTNTKKKKVKPRSKAYKLNVLYRLRNFYIDI